MMDERPTPIYAGLPDEERVEERGFTSWFARYWLSLPISFMVMGLIVGSGPLIGLGACLILGGLVARYWSRHAFDRVRYDRVLPENRAFPGDRIGLTLRLVNDKLLPLPWLEMRDPIPEGVYKDEKHLRPAGYQGYELIVRSAHLGSYERITWPIEFVAPQRGYYRLGPARLSSSDIFGLFPVDKTEGRSDSIIVFPRTYTLPELGLPSYRPFGERRGADRIFEDPGRIAGARDYRPGDPLRRIDWKASARRQTLQSRVYEPSSTLHLLIAVNVNTLEHSWEGYIPGVLERLLSVAASVARYGYDAGYAIGVVANSSYPASDRPLRVPVGRSNDQLGRVLEALAVVGPLTVFPLEAIIDREAQSFPFGATLVVVTSRMDPSLAASILNVAGAGHSVTVLSLSEEEFDADLGPVPTINLSRAMASLEARDGTQA